MTKQMTPWFPADVKPVRVGLYEIQTTTAWRPYYAYWSGKQWGLIAAHPTSARWKTIAFTDGAYQEKIWRGFTKEQK